VVLSENLAVGLVALPLHDLQAQVMEVVCSEASSAERDPCIRLPSPISANGASREERRTLRCEMEGCEHYREVACVWRCLTSYDSSELDALGCSQAKATSSPEIAQTALPHQGV
jgi:hypothetical protein